MNGLRFEEVAASWVCKSRFPKRRAEGPARPWVVRGPCEAPEREALSLFLKDATRAGGRDELKKIRWDIDEDECIPMVMSEPRAGSTVRTTRSKDSTPKIMGTLICTCHVRRGR